MYIGVNIKLRMDGMMEKMGRRWGKMGRRIGCLQMILSLFKTSIAFTTRSRFALYPIATRGQVILGDWL